jgi:hypothetical protein
MTFTVEEKTRIYGTAVIEALAIAGKEAGEPDINAALGALVEAQAYLIASIKDRNMRRLAEKQSVGSLGRHIALQVEQRLEREKGALDG